MRDALRNKKLIALMKNMLYAVEDLYILAFYTENIFIESVDVLLGFSVGKISPETDLATVLTLVVISVDIRRILLRAVYVIQRRLHEIGKCFHINSSS
jgi:hypothetical protein